MNVGVIPPRGRLPAAAARARRRVRRAPDLRRGEDRRQARLGRRAGVLRVKADMVCLAKAIGGGLPLGAFGASRKIMDEIAQLPLVPRRHLREQPARHHRLHRRARADPHARTCTSKATALGNALAEGHNKIIKRHRKPWVRRQPGHQRHASTGARSRPRNYREWLRPGLEVVLALLAHEPQPRRDPAGAELGRAVDGVGPAHPGRCRHHARASSTK